MTTLTIKSSFSGATLLNLLQQRAQDRRDARRARASAPKPPDEPQLSQGQPLTDIAQTLELYDTPIVKGRGNVPFYGKELYVRPIRNEKDSGGNLVQKFYGGFSLGEARPGARMVKMWFGDTVVFDDTDSKDVIQANGLNFRFYSGEADQPADPIILEDFPSQPWAYRHLMSVWIDGWDISQTNGLRPSIVRCEIWDSSSTAPEAVQIAADANDGAMLPADWDGGRYWLMPNTGGGTTMRTYNLYDDSLMQTSTIAWSGVFYELNIAHYVEWLDLIIGAGPVSGGGVPELIAIEPNGASVAGVSSGFGTGITATQMIPIKVTTALNNIETYIIGASFASSALHFASYDSGTFSILTHTLPTLPGEPTAMCKGPEDASQSSAYIAAGTGASAKIYKFDIEAGGFATGAEVYAAAETISAMWYDDSDGGLVIAYSSSNNEKRLASDDSFSLLWSASFTGSAAFPHGTRVRNRIGYENWTANQIITVDLGDGETTTYGESEHSANGFFLWDGVTRSLFGTRRSGGSAVPKRFYTQIVTRTRTLLRDDLEELMLDAGYAASDFDFTEVTDSIDARFITQNVNMNTHLADVARFWGYTLVDSDKVYLKALPTSGNPTIDATITDGEIILESDGEGASLVTILDEDEGETLFAAEFSYLSDDIGYNWTLARAQNQAFPNLAFDQGRTVRIRVPYVIRPNEATTLVHKHLFRENFARRSFDFANGFRSFGVDLGGVVDVTTTNAEATDRTRRIRVDTGQTIDFANGQVIQQARDYLETHNLSFKATAGIKNADPTLTSEPTDAFLLNLPLLKPHHDLGGLGMATYMFLLPRNRNRTWAGGNGFVSIDGGKNFDRVATQTTAPTMGYVVTPLGTTDTPHATDNVNTITIRKIHGADSDFSSTSTLNFLSDNTTKFAVGKNGRWEVISCQNWTNNGNGTFTGDTVLRAQLGTEPFIGGHKAGDFAFALNDGYWDLVTFNATFNAGVLVEPSILYTGAGIGQNINKGIRKRVTIDGTAEKPYLPVHIEGNYNETNGLTLTGWVRQTRGRGEWLDGTATVPLFQNAQLYEVDVLNTAGGTAVLTYGGDGSITSPGSLNIPQADLVSAFGLVPSQLSVVVYQIGDLGARGYGREITFDTGLSKPEYWKVSSSQASGLSYANLQFREFAGITQQHTVGTPFASSQFNVNFPPESAFQTGGGGPYWLSGSTPLPHEIGINMGAGNGRDAIELYTAAGTGGGGAADFDVKASRDGVTYATVKSFTGQALLGSSEAAVFSLT